MQQNLDYSEANLISRIENDKIAICISGNLRTFRDCYQNLFTNIIDVLRDKYIVDTFISIWTHEAQEDIREAIEIYKPKKYVMIENFKFELSKEYENMLFYKRRKDLNGYFGDITKMHYGINKAFEAIDSTYTHIFRIRYDDIFETSIDLNTLNDNVYVGNGHLFSRGNIPSNMNDAFGYGPYEKMKRYGDFYNHIDEIILDIKNGKLPENYKYLESAITVTLLFKYYIAYVQNIKVLESKIRFGLQRHNGTVTYFKANSYHYKGFPYIINNNTK